MIGLLFKMMFEDILSGLMEFVPDHFKRKDMYNKVVHNKPWTLRHVSDPLKTQDMCNEAERLLPYLLQYAPDHFKREDMRIKALGGGPWLNIYLITLKRKACAMRQ